MRNATMVLQAFSLLYYIFLLHIPAGTGIAGGPACKTQNGTSAVAYQLATPRFGIVKIPFVVAAASAFGGRGLGAGKIVVEGACRTGCLVFFAGRK